MNWLKQNGIKVGVGILVLVAVFTIFVYIYSEAAFKQRAKEIEAMTDSELIECIEENHKNFIYGGSMTLSSTATDREVMEAQCFYKNYSVHRI